MPFIPDLQRIPRKAWIIAGGIFAVVVVVLLTSSALVSGEIGRRMDQRLAERGWTLERDRVAWSPWSGFSVSGVKLRKGDAAPALEADTVVTGFTLAQLMRGKDAPSEWRVIGSPLVLRDADGEIRLDKVSVEAAVSRGLFQIQKASASAAGLSTEVTGEIKWGGDSGGNGGYVPRFNAVRGVLAALKIGDGRFKITGTFAVDNSGSARKWTAKLHGTGKELVWNGLPLQSAQAEANLSEGDSRIAGTLSLPEGKGDFTILKDGWKKPGFPFAGTLTDAAGRVDTFKGRYLGKGAWRVDEAEGNADLWAMGHHVPGLARHLPDKVRVETFPRIELRGLEGNREGGLKLRSVNFDGSGKAEARVGERRVDLTGISGSAGYADGTWQLKRVGGKIFGGEVRVSGGYQDSVLSDSTVTAVGVRLAELKAWSGQKSQTKGILSGTYRGRINTKETSLVGKGEVKLENAPLFDIPLLGQTYELFRAAIPGVERAKSGEFNASFVARENIVEVPRFEATGGTLHVSAKGSVDLDKKRVDGVARGKLTGIPGLVTNPLARLLEMEVGGPYDDIRVKPLGPAKLVSNAASTTVGTAVDTLEEGIKITGEVLKEGVKLPFRWMGKEDEDAPQ
ncbi:hypothetical protein [Luteolibacter sp. Populi]|uniref:hypothetical protein n=1 Tax=Luteolibacter sp. Populi TaxID=3230487 RepID=UPI0034655857